MKYTRLGWTEGTLFMIWYIQKRGLGDVEKDHNMVNWLFSTSGYYDKQIKGHYFDLTPEECDKVLNSATFNALGLIEPETTWKIT